MVHMYPSMGINNIDSNIITNIITNIFDRSYVCQGSASLGPGEGRGKNNSSMVNVLHKNSSKECSSLGW